MSLQRLDVKLSSAISLQRQRLNAKLGSAIICMPIRHHKVFSEFDESTTANKRKKSVAPFIYGIGRTQCGNVGLVKQQLMKWTVERNGTSLEFWDQAIPSIMVILNNRDMTGVGTTPAMSNLNRFQNMNGLTEKCR